MSYDCPICLIPINEEGPTAAVEGARDTQENSDSANVATAAQAGRGRKRARDGTRTDIFSTSPSGGQCTTSCGHLFHIGCLEQHFNGQATASCPTCTKKNWRSKLVRVYLSQNPVGTKECSSKATTGTDAPTTKDDLFIPDIPLLFQNNVTSYMEDMNTIARNIKLLAEVSKVNVLLLNNLGRNLQDPPATNIDEVESEENAEAAESEPAVKKRRSISTTFRESSAANRLLMAQSCSAITLSKV